jgi:hypothetical protein
MHVPSKVIDMGLQGGNLLISSASQTIWNRKINKVIETSTST